jgi:plasmid maintenance system killer protein
MKQHAHTRGVRVDDPCRIVFRWSDRSAHEVRLVDYETG